MSRFTSSQVNSFILDRFPAVHVEMLSAPGNLQIDQTYKAEIATLLEMLDQIPPALISLDPIDLVMFMLAKQHLVDAVFTWQSRNMMLQDRRHAQGELRRPSVVVIYMALLKCPDEIIANLSSKFSFISDEAMRSSLEGDLSSVDAAHLNGAYKASTVLASSATEALLLWDLAKQESSKIKEAIALLSASPKGGIGPHVELEHQSWSLSGYLEVALQLERIRSVTYDQALIGKNFRNLIHPARAKRTNQLCNRATSMAAIAGLDFVIDDIARHYP